MLSHPGAKLAQSAPFHLSSMGFEPSDTLPPWEGERMGGREGERMGGRERRWEGGRGGETDEGGEEEGKKKQ